MMPEEQEIDLKKVILTALLVVCFSASALFAQQPASATLSGRVTDPAGAVIAGAKVTATQKATGAERSTLTRLEPIVEVFNLLNVTNILGVSNVNYSGFSNVLTRDSGNPADAGFLRSSGFGSAVTAAGGVFGSGGPRAFQIAVKFSF